MPFDATNPPADLTCEQRFTILRDTIARLPKRKFNMGLWEKHTPSCGTVACIGGWIQTLFTDGTREIGSIEAGKLIGIDYDQATSLFYPETDNGDLTDLAWKATPAQAVRVLDHLKETGKVDWSVMDG